MNLMARILLLVNSLWMRIKRSTSFGICVWNLCSYSYIRFGTMAKLVVSIFWGVALVWIADMRGEYGSFVTLITSMRVMTVMTGNCLWHVFGPPQSPMQFLFHQPKALLSTYLPLWCKIIWLIYISPTPTHFSL